jgi:septum formation protein
MDDSPEILVESEAGLAHDDGPAVILASASAARRMLLGQAGVPHVIEPARIDELAIKESLRAEQATPGQAAETLAELKAQKISTRHPDALVIGADQMMDCEDRWYDKPGSLAEAAEQIRALAGRTHRLSSAVVTVRRGSRTWHAVGEARLTMRPLDDGYIDRYLEAVGERALDSVGGYQLESAGVQLFSRIEGDYFSILGLPLLPLLESLRNQGVLVR